MTSNIITERNMADVCRTIVKPKSCASKLKPVKRKLDRIVTERVYRIARESSDKARELTALFQIIEDDALVFSIPDEELRHLVLHHQKLVKNYSMEKYFIRDNVAMDIQLSLKDVLRVATLKGLKLAKLANKEGITWEFRAQLLALCNIMHEKLLTEAPEISSQNRFLLKTMEKSRNYQCLIQKLNSTLAEQKTLKAQKLGEQDAVIKQMRRTLDSMIEIADVHNNNTLNEAAKQILAEKKSLDDKQSNLHHEITELKNTLDKQTHKHSTVEAKLRKRKFKMSGELHNWILKYDQDMGWRQEQINELEKLNKQDLEDIKQLEHHFVEVKLKYDVIMEERRLKKEKALCQASVAYARKMASIKIQAIFRGFLVRNVVKKKKAGKPKKGAKRK